MGYHRVLIFGCGLTRTATARGKKRDKSSGLWKYRTRRIARIRTAAQTVRPAPGVRGTGGPLCLDPNTPHPQAPSTKARQPCLYAALSTFPILSRNTASILGMSADCFCLMAAAFGAAQVRKSTRKGASRSRPWSSARNTGQSGE